MAVFLGFQLFIRQVLCAVKSFLGDIQEDSLTLSSCFYDDGSSPV